MKETSMPSHPGLQRTRIAIITGAGSGIGAAVARQLAALGWKVVLGGRTEEKLNVIASAIRAAGGSAEAVVCDVTLAADVARLVAAAGPVLDAMIHSAGQGHCLTIDELDEDEFRQTLDVAVLGAFLTTKAALPKLRATQGGCGHVIQICSLASGGTWNREIGYGTAKGAQLKFTLHLEAQLKDDAAKGGRVIHAHAVCPGTVDTPFWNRIPERIIEPDLILLADEVAWLVTEIIKNPLVTAAGLSFVKPRKEVVIKSHPPFERWPNVIAIAHESHP
ncbi:MAG TPA: SDR family oxidoreductase [Lacunisphaera sp.]|jgi:NAD(P)-dependent dehydrogenase (short-subunit alcohol dehydrogenase family)